jgi:hypothetical protein
VNSFFVSAVYDEPTRAAHAQIGYCIRQVKRHGGDLPLCQAKGESFRINGIRRRGTDLTEVREAGARWRPLRRGGRITIFIDISSHSGTEAK